MLQKIVSYIIRIYETISDVKDSFYRLLHSGAPLSLINEKENTIQEKVYESMKSRIKGDKHLSLTESPVREVLTHELNHQVGRKRLFDCYSWVTIFRRETEKNRIIFSSEKVQIFDTLKGLCIDSILTFEDYLKDAENWNGLWLDKIELYKSRDFRKFAKQSLDDITNQSNLIEEELRKLLLVP
ncbi:MAG: hypothetical protein OXC61_11270 [Flavobacteriaceae bacterium]|nr:hypothetical protein [Flavobacteriaceae bacterium]